MKDAMAVGFDTLKSGHGKNAKWVM
jgi:hypothetical protein